MPGKGGIQLCARELINKDGWNVSFYIKTKLNGPNEHPDTLSQVLTLGCFCLRTAKNLFLEKVEERQAPEEKEAAGEIGGLGPRGRKRLGDLGLPRGEGQKHL